MADPTQNIERLKKIMNVQKGDKGDPGEDADAIEFPVDLTVLFENAMA